MKNVIYLLILLPLLLTSCEDVIDINLKQGASALTVDGWITTEDKPYIIKLSKTGPYFDSTRTPAVRGAMVTITDSEGHKDSLIEVSPGEYATLENRKGKVGNSYILNIQIEGERYAATTEIKRVEVIDSLTLKYEDNIKEDKRGYNVYYFGNESAGMGDYYKFRITRNDTLLNKPEDVWNITSDEWVDGNYIADLKMYNLLKPGGKIKIETMSITKDAYQFYVELAAQVNNGGMFSNPPANIRTNVINLNPNSNKRAVGYFGGSAISSMEIRAPFRD